MRLIQKAAIVTVALGALVAASGCAPGVSGRSYGRDEALHHATVVAAGQDDDRCGRMHGVPVRAAAEGQIELVAKRAKIGERVVLAVVEDAADRHHPHARERVGFQRSRLRSERGGGGERAHGGHHRGDR